MLKTGFNTHILNKTVSEYYQEMLQSHTADHRTAPRGRATEYLK